MKKLSLLFLLVSFCFLSCNDDDEISIEQTSENDSIVGRWLWSKQVYELEDNSTVEIEASECVSICETEFKADGTLIFTTYNEDFDGNCVLNSEILEYGTWNKISNGVYEITSKYENEEEEVQVENIEFVNENEFRYINDEENGVYENQNILISYEYRNKIN